MNLCGLGDGAAVLLDVLAWAALGVTVGWLAPRLPAAWIERDRGPLRLRSFEAGGRFYDRWLRIGWWKDRLPDAGGTFRGGRRKERLVRKDPAALGAFAVETRRAELVHVALVAAGPFFVLWNPWDLAAVMVTYAIIANVPCLLVQRHNRARVAVILARS